MRSVALSNTKVCDQVVQGRSFFRPSLRVAAPPLVCSYFTSHRMSLIPGDEYISSCLWPFRTRYSIAEKSFLSSPMALSNSALPSILAEFTLTLGAEQAAEYKYLAYFSKCCLAFSNDQHHSITNCALFTSCFVLLTRRHCLYSDNTSFCNPDSLMLVPCSCNCCTKCCEDEDSNDDGIRKMLQGLSSPCLTLPKWGVGFRRRQFWTSTSSSFFSSYKSDIVWYIFA